MAERSERQYSRFTFHASRHTSRSKSSNVNPAFSQTALTLRSRSIRLARLAVRSIRRSLTVFRLLSTGRSIEGGSLSVLVVPSPLGRGLGEGESFSFCRVMVL